MDKTGIHDFAFEIASSRTVAWRTYSSDRHREIPSLAFILIQLSGTRPPKSLLIAAHAASISTVADSVANGNTGSAKSI